MAAYLIARSRIHNAAAYKRYTDEVPALVKKYGGKFLARGTPYQVLEGPEKFQRFVIIEFPSADQARKFYACAEYKKAALNRQAPDVCDFELVLVDGGIGADPLSAHSVQGFGVG
jgi:uncharacterized protein (DUF1330 family)